jgi:hypothetical protein
MKQFILACFLSIVILITSITAADAAPPAKDPGSVAGFTKIGQGGFGDSANSYSWSVQWFKGNLYVGTNRHHLHSMFEALSYMPNSPISPTMMPDYLIPAPPEPATWFQREWAEAFQGELWRYNKDKQWERVHQAGVLGPVPLLPPYQAGTMGHVPVAYGYRAMAEFNGYLYACGIATWMPPMPFNSIVRSATGDPGSWENVSGVIAQTTNIRAITTWNGKLYVAASVNGGAAVFASADPKTVGWAQVNAPGFGVPDNSEIYYMTVFNNELYASTVNLVTGFELWKTNGVPGTDGQYAWTRVIKNGFGDTWNQFGMTMAVLGDHLYVGTAVGIGMVMKKNPSTGQDEVVGTRAIEVIRVDKAGNAELVVGASEASDPIEGGPTPRDPLSGMGAGFNNPFNVYAWNMNVYNKCLYLGTFDMSIFAIGALEKDPSILPFFLQVYAPDLPPQVVAALAGGVTPQTLALLKRYFAGGDLWKSCDGVNWSPVTINGFNNFYNYGIREVIPIQNNGRDSGLAIGTANPFTGKPNGGCEIWLNGKLPR